jgi:hypothetical protein
VSQSGVWEVELQAGGLDSTRKEQSAEQFPRTPVVRQMTPTLARGLSENMAGLMKSCDRPCMA